MQGTAGGGSKGYPAPPTRPGPGRGGGGVIAVPMETLRCDAFGAAGVLRTCGLLLKATGERGARGSLEEEGGGRKASSGS